MSNEKTGTCSGHEGREGGKGGPFFGVGRNTQAGCLGEKGGKKGAEVKELSHRGGGLGVRKAGEGLLSCLRSQGENYQAYLKGLGLG